jgi:hypothetical protein
MSTITTSTNTNKENNKNNANVGGGKYKKFMGGNPSLQGKTFEITSKDAVHHFADALKAIADYVGTRIYTRRRYMIFDREYDGL